MMDRKADAIPAPQATITAIPRPGSAILRALRHPNYRLFFGGQLVSVIGTFLTNTAMGWLASTLTTDAHRKALFISLVLFASQFPLFLLGPIAGVWVDRLNRQKLLVFTQSASLVQSFLLAALAFSHAMTMPRAIALALLQGLINALDIPARQAFLIEMVTDRDDLANAIALNSTMAHAARLIGPAIAGLLIHFSSMGWCFLLDGFSYFAVIAALLAMHVQPRPAKARHSVLFELREGFNYVTRFQPARELLLLVAIFSLTGAPAFQVLVPIFAIHFAHVAGSPSSGDLFYGFLSAASGLGALVGAIRLASRKSVRGLGRVIGIASLLYGLSCAAFALAPSLHVALFVMLCAGWGMITNFAACNTILQTLVDDDKRGRVMSFFAMAFMGMMPFGVLLSGMLATHLSSDAHVAASRTLLIMACICVAASLRFWMVLPMVRKYARPIYVQRGILPEMAEEMQTTEAAIDAET